MKFISLFVLFCSCACATAQVKNFSVAVAVNHPVIADVTNEFRLSTIPIGGTGYFSSTASATLREAYEEKAGFEVATGFQVFRFKKFFIETGIAFHYYRYKRSFSVDLAAPAPVPDFLGQPFGTIGGYPIVRISDGSTILNPGTESIFPERGPNLGETTTFYVRVPVTVGAAILKGSLRLKAGLVADFLAHATEYKETYSYHSGMDEFKDRSKKGFSKILAGGVLKSTYLITKRVGIDLSYNRSFTRIYTNDEVGRSYYNIFSIGGSYYFFDFKSN